ncbi:autophagy protein Atg22 [Histoplasma capsulatum G186AR]|uniref:Autophagy-related protein n=1 Tax=Ajellomyces capsulatus TaxID=5037 RepID=A0A8H8CXP8_AJECA|nr:autophagy protein Atg22 [Histoplasma capsulatum]QSS75035.1 autophagy protein Atg22 [Histoplasma capsulatum G186AR]
MMDSHEPVGHRYAGEDTRSTSKKELSGWYCYGWAAEVFTVCAMGSFLPITLEQMARDRGVLLSDKSTPCSATWGTASDLPSPTASSPNGPHSPKTSQCIIYFLGMEINTASFAMYTFSMSVLIQSLLIISMSGAADHGVYRKTLLLVFAVVGAVSTMLFLAVVPQVYLLGALLAIVANTCFGASFVLLNSFLPLLVRHHPTIQSTPVRRLLDSGYDDDDVHSSNALVEPESSESLPPDLSPTLPLLQDDATVPVDDSQLKSSKISAELQLSTRISSNGIGIGYIGAVILQIASILIIVATGSTTFSLRLTLFGIGLWWLLFTIPAAMWLRPRPGPPLPSSARDSKMWPCVSYITYAWKSLGRTALQARHLKDVLIFLAVWFLLSDGIATVSGTAVLFAKTQLDMKLAALGLINVIAMISGVCGAFCWNYLSRRLHLRASQTIIACICVFELIPFYGLLGFIPAIKRLGVFGLQKPWEMYVLGAVYGLVMGGLSSYCRSFFGELIPPGFETSFYALYAITDKGSSIFGPAIVGLITDRYGEIRPAFGFLAVLILIPLPLMLLIDVDRGKRDAAFLADELEGRRRETL